MANYTIQSGCLSDDYKKKHSTEVHFVFLTDYVHRVT